MAKGGTDHMRRGGKAFIVNRETLPVLLRYGIVATGSRHLGAQWLKSICSLFADILSVREGDLVFFWEISAESFRELFPGRGFFGVYEIRGRPFFDPTPLQNPEGTLPSNFAIRVPIKAKCWFANPVSEHQIFNDPRLFQILWNPRYKKVLGRGRSASPLTPQEAEILLQVLWQHNHQPSVSPEQLPYPNEQVMLENVISVNLSQTTDEVHHPDLISMENLLLNQIPYATPDGSVTCEKVLEGWLSENIDANTPTLVSIFGPADHIQWFGNYLPYSIQMENMDFAVIHSDPSSDAVIRITIVELQKDRIDDKHIDKVLKYARWISRNLLPDAASMVQPVVIGRSASQRMIEYANGLGFNRQVWLVAYEVRGGTLHLTPENFTPQFP
jgi:hypothetical protein